MVLEWWKVLLDNSIILYYVVVKTFFVPFCTIIFFAIAEMRGLCFLMKRLYNYLVKLKYYFGKMVIFVIWNFISRRKNEKKNYVGLSYFRKIWQILICSDFTITWPFFRTLALKSKT